MTEAMGEDCAPLADACGKEFPDVGFEFFNYGVGGTRAGYGLWRLTHDYEHQGRTWKSLVSLNPDIVLVESFAYNNGSDGTTNGIGLRHFRDVHRKIIGTLKKSTNAKIVFVATIAPDPSGFLAGNSNFMNTPASIRRWMANDRAAYLREGIRLAKRLGVPLANVYQECLALKRGGTPLGTFIGDGIHPSGEGLRLIARTIAATLKSNQLL